MWVGFEWDFSGAGVCMYVTESLTLVACLPRVESAAAAAVCHEQDRLDDAQTRVPQVDVVRYLRCRAVE